MDDSNKHSNNQILSIFDPIQELDLDYLGRYQFARRLLKRVSAPNCSSVVGLYGGWGVGKTSILNLIMTINKQERLSLLEKPLLEYIDVWPYEISGDLALPILVQMREWMKALQPDTYIENWRRILSVLTQAGMDISLRKVIGLQLSDVKTYIDNYQHANPHQVNLRHLENLVDDIRGAQDAFCELVQLISKAHQNRRVVFLVDNLDRCSPENVVRLLESVKNFLHAPNCVWVFAMDSGVVASYIDRKYDGTRMDGNSYLDKIIPEQYHIPPVSEHDVERLQRFLGKVQPVEGHSFPVINLNKIPNLPEVLIPRRLLKTAHKFYEAYTTDTELGSPASPDLIFSLILLYNTWPSFYERLSSGTLDHVRGILANFIAKDKHPYTSIPISQNFLDDRALNHYLNYCFIRDQKMDDICSSLAVSMVWLREVGLP